MNRELKRLLEDVARGEIGPAISARARGLLAPRKRVARDVGPDRKAQRKDERRKRMADIREAVMVRAEGECELCHEPAAEVHHLVSGGLRQHRESVETLIALCQPHHLAAHRNGMATLETLEEWAIVNRYGEAQAALRRRIDKAIEARGAEARSPRGGRQEGRTG
jgi:5-methylcytosine-specific restriction endonuclease McrA